MDLFKKNKFLFIGLEPGNAIENNILLVYLLAHYQPFRTLFGGWNGEAVDS